MFELDLLDLLERNHHLLRSVSPLDLQVKVVGCNAADALADILAARRLDHQDHIAVGIAPHDAEEPRKLRLEEPPIERKLAALKGGRGRHCRLRWLRLGVGKPQCTGMFYTG